MGAWDTGTFDNDTACDWSYRLDECDDLSVVWSAIEEVFRGEYVDSNVACHALAAAEVVARMKGNWGERSVYSETVDQWVHRHTAIQVPQKLPPRCVEAIERILAPDSELNELWKESESY